MGSKKSNHSDNKSKKTKQKKKHSDGGSGIITDSRFASVQSDPRFQKVQKHKTKVEIDSRFDRIFKDPKFAGSSAPVDKRGKPKKKSESENFLKNYYRIEDSKAEKDEAEEEEEPEAEEERIVGESATDSSDESEAFEVGDEELDGMESDTTSDEDDEEGAAVYLLDDDEPEAPEENVPEIDKETRRLAVVNMDWRHVKASDLYVMLTSFLPKSGQILSVAVYPSEFGLQRMKEEDLRGPAGLFNEESDDSDGDDDELDNEKLRAYEKSKLRYYYAVVECDSVATADYLYKTCDRTEFERSSNVLDLRFIPDSMEFKHQPRDVATEAPTNYEGLNFHTQALQQSKIHLSWDEDEPDRAKTLKRKLNSEQLEQLELKEYLASSDSESDEDEDDTEDKSEKKRKKRDLYRALINSGPSGNASDDNYEGKDDDDEAQEMEVTFNTGLDELGKKILEKRSRKDETVWEAHLREKREKKKLRKSWSNDSSDDQSGDDDQEAVEEPDGFVEDEPPSKKHKKSEGRSSKSKKLEGADRVAEATVAELELLVADDTIADTGVKGYNMKRLKVKGKGKDRKKGKGKTIDEEKIPFPSIADDPRFSVIFTSPEFAMDPTDPQFKRSATYARQVAMRKQKRNEGFTERDDSAPPELPVIAEEKVKSDDRSSNTTKYELSTEIKSVKMRCQQIKVPSNEGATPTKDDSPKSSKKKGKIRDDDLNSMLKSVKKHSLSSKKGKTYKQL